jgi:hypothetical protein
LLPDAYWLLLTAAAIQFRFRLGDAFSSREPGSRFARKRDARINSVDGFHAALEIDSRSSYVLNLTLA